MTCPSLTFFFFFFLFLSFFLAVLGLHCSEQGLLSLAEHGLLVVVASLVVEQELWGAQAQ